MRLYEMTPAHPIERFAAPATITAGRPLRALFDPELVGLIGESFAAVYRGFDLAAFERNACRGLDQLAMIQRANRIADALAAELPADFPTASEILIAALGPELTRTEKNGLRPFFYWPHSSYVARYGEAHFESGMKANYELTQRFTAEFSVRPFVAHHQDRALSLLMKWTRDENPHVRRLCSEGTRPRLPWASRLPVLQADPDSTAPLLEALKDDPDPYVRRSVANHLGDVCKDHPRWVFELCGRWLDEAERAPASNARLRRWMVHHALRLPAKHGVEVALEIRERARAHR